MHFQEYVLKNILWFLVPVSSSSSSTSSSSSSTGVNGRTNAQFAHTQSFPGAGFGYNYGNAYPSYPAYNPYGQFHPGNHVQAASLNSRGSFGDDAPSSNQATYTSFGSNAGAAPPNFNPYFNNFQHQQNAYV